MKKLIYTLCLFFVTANVSFAYNEYWGRYPNMKDRISQIPEASDSYISFGRQLITNDKLDCCVSMNLSWSNFFTREQMVVVDICGYWTVVEIKYDRRVYYAIGNSYQEIGALRVTDGVIDVRDISLRPSDENEFYFSTQECSVEFTDSIAADISELEPNKEYKLKVEYSFTVVPEVDICGSDYDPTETVRYVTKQNVSVQNTSTGSIAKFKKFANKTNSVINVNSSCNPVYNTGSGDVYLIYNNPDAAISVIADTVNLPERKAIINGTGVIYLYGVGAYLASIGATSFPTKISTSIQTTGCGVIDVQCSKKCNGITEPTIEFLNDNPTQKAFLKSKGYLQQNYCYRRRTNVLQRSINPQMTTYYESTIDNFALSRDKDCRMNRVFHLRDLSNVDVYAKKGYGAGSIIKIQNSAIYNSFCDLTNYSRYQDFYSMGYMFYGPSDDTDIASGAGVISNILEFEVVNEATLPAISASDKLPKMTCVTDSLLKEGDFIHLKGAAIQCGNYSETLYRPDYIWEVSFNGNDWEPLDKRSFPKYIIDRISLNFAVVMDTEKDILLKSTILKNREQVQFRQKVILKSFASDEFSALYNYKEGDKYYISVVSKDFYTYIPTPILDKDNITFTPSKFPVEQRLCKGDALENPKISFKLKSSTNVSDAQIKKLSEIADYKVYELQGDTVGKLVSNTDSYVINYSGKTVGYRCVVLWCTDSIYKDVHIIANDDEVIDLKDIYSNVVIAEKNPAEKKVRLLCQRGSYPTISLFENNDKEYDYQYRSVVPYTEPVITVTDFTTMSRTKIISYMKSAGWDYEAETGTNVDNAGIDALRAWCRVKEDKTNGLIISDSKNKNMIANSWCSFTDNNTTLLPISNSDEPGLDFYIMKKNTNTKCYSDSVKVEIVFFDGIEDNKIAFSAAADASKREIYVMKNATSPAIKGFVIKGGYGVPAATNDFKYIYRYIYKETDGVWQQLAPDIEVSGDDNKNVSLKSGALTMDRMYQVARIVYSRVGNDLSTQVSDTSNILTINVIEELKRDDIEVYNNGSCAGSVVTLGVTKYAPTDIIKKATHFIWAATDTSVTLVPSGEMDKYCSLYNTSDDFSVSVYREDTITGAKTQTVVIPIEVLSVKPSFSITADGITRNILDYPDENFYFQSGTRFILNNNSDGADSYLWNLELQYYTGTEVEGLTSYNENPVCYLYNPGQNKIRLTARNTLGCESQITAENIFIQSSSVRSVADHSHFSEVEYLPQPSTRFAADFDVYPTVTKGEDINIFYSKGVFHSVLISQLGHKVWEAESSNFCRIEYENIPDGLYTLVLEAEDNGFLVNKTVRIIKQ